MREYFKQKKGKGWYLRTIDLKDFKGFDLLKFHELEKSKYPYLLESSAKGNKFARFSIIFFKPKIVLIKENLSSKKKFLHDLDFIWKKNRIPQEGLSTDLDLLDL